MNIPHVGYTYCITFLKTNQVYYGSRCAKNCHPSEFWVKYFTSSKLIKELINTHGKNSFICQIRKTFPENPKDAQKWERRLLKRIQAGKNPKFLNKSDGVAPILSGWKNPFYGKKHSDESKNKMSGLAKERLKDPTNNSMYGKKHSESTKNFLSKQRKGISYQERYGEFRSNEIKLKASKKLSGSNNPMFGKKRPELTGSSNPMKDETVRNKHAESIKNRPTIICNHCGKQMDKGGYAVHERALKKKGLI